MQHQHAWKSSDVINMHFVIQNQRQNFAFLSIFFFFFCPLFWILFNAAKYSETLVLRHLGRNIYILNAKNNLNKLMWK